MVTEGYGILQPRIGVSIQSSARSRLAALYSGETGFDIYTRAVSDVYQDLFGEGIFTGKGIYDVDVMRAVLERRFPDNALLSHDLIEGAYARAALVSDIELIDDYPSHFSAYNRRKHRWVRGDWQILRWIFPRVPDYTRRLVPNPITLISRWKILDNLRRSLFDPSLLLLLLGGWLVLPGAPGLLDRALAIAVLFLPALLRFAVLASAHAAPALRASGRGRATPLRAFANGHAIALFGLIFLLHQALLSIDAITRSVLRVFVTRKKLLEWETAAEAEAASRSKATVDVYLEWTPWIGAALAVLVALLRPAALSAAAPVLLLWIASRAVSGWLNRAPRAMKGVLGREDREWLRSQSERIWRYFHDWSSPATNWFIPDSVREDGKVDLRLSPTNLGLLLNARVAALEFGFTNPGEFVFQTRQTLDRVGAVCANIAATCSTGTTFSSLEPLHPHFVSTVDSGNLAAALWTLKQAALALAAEGRGLPGSRPNWRRSPASRTALVREMDFAFLYHSRKKVLSVGFDLSSGRLEPSCYDLLASEARIAVFVAIAKGDIPQEAWFHLGRAHTLADGKRVLLSWTGTMFEYLMPALWMKHLSEDGHGPERAGGGARAARVVLAPGSAVGNFRVGLPRRGAGRRAPLRPVWHPVPRAAAAKAGGAGDCSVRRLSGPNGRSAGRGPRICGGWKNTAGRARTASTKRHNIRLRARSLFGHGWHTTRVWPCWRFAICSWTAPSKDTSTPNRRCLPPRCCWTSASPQPSWPRLNPNRKRMRLWPAPRDRAARYPSSPYCRKPTASNARRACGVDMTEVQTDPPRKFSAMRSMIP